VYVYVDQDALLHEDAQLLPVNDTPSNVLTPDSYGALKRLCEKVALAHFGHSALILRPSIIIGIGDHTERTLFWLRLAEIHGKRIDFVGREPAVQLVDVRDLARLAFPQTSRHISKRSLTLPLEFLRAKLIEIILTANTIVINIYVIEDL
jgi:2'-hydroxyisoflavone reductase